MKIKVYTIEFKTPRWLRNALTFVVVPGMILLGVGAAVRAAGLSSPLKTFVTRTPISSGDLTSNFTALQNVVNGVSGAAVQNAMNATTASTASNLSCNGCVAKSSIAGGAVLSSLAVTVVDSNPAGTVFAPAGFSQPWASCPSGTTMIGGGCRSQTSAIQVFDMFMSQSENRYYCSFQNNLGAANPLPHVFAYCLGTQ